MRLPNWFHGLAVRTLDSESSNPSSNLGGTSFFAPFCSLFFRVIRIAKCHPKVLIQMRVASSFDNGPPVLRFCQFNPLLLVREFFFFQQGLFAEESTIQGLPRVVGHVFLCLFWLMASRTEFNSLACELYFHDHICQQHLSCLRRWGLAVSEHIQGKKIVQTHHSRLN